ncbi:hypothetical protein DSO57_1027019 [Entomophthora muscae]|uniref:Uncharacterized protein n=1 Tax=Entomophthora muscae TaxID=34485 RepID=A0ACC2TZS3_9FUNG|nr:hypothetical protein DSO57_1027019 [Entomophthora muscae]
MRELEKILKDLDSEIANIKEIDYKVKPKLKSTVLEGEKIGKVSALIVKMPDTPKKTIGRLLNLQKKVVEGLQFKCFALSLPSFWVDNPKMYDHLKPAKQVRTEDSKLLAQLLAPRMANPAKAATMEKTIEGSGCTSIPAIAIIPNIQSLPDLVPFQYTI